MVRTPGYHYLSITQNQSQPQRQDRRRIVCSKLKFHPENQLPGKGDRSRETLLHIFVLPTRCFCRISLFYSSLNICTPLQPHSLCGKAPFIRCLLDSSNGISIGHRLFNELLNTNLNSVGLPAPCPALSSSLRSSGCGLPPAICWSVAASLKECIGTTRSSSIVVPKAETVDHYQIKGNARSAVINNVGGSILSAGTLCTGEMG